MEIFQMLEDIALPENFFTKKFNAHKFYHMLQCSKQENKAKC